MSQQVSNGSAMPRQISGDGAMPRQISGDGVFPLQGCLSRQVSSSSDEGRKMRRTTFKEEVEER